MEEKGVNVHKLKIGTKLKITTNNTVYEIEISKKPGFVYITGGQFIPERKLLHFNGCTYGGSCIKVGWICFDMHMEIHTGPNRVITTSPVKNITIYGDEWEYELEHKFG